ncbi:MULTISPECIES: type II toxin-antitoxin system PemK/MazF family toxin [unclassified Gordonia (in: high G+C Gram-positive bacteria)]
MTGRAPGRPTHEFAREIVYSPDLDGAADPGEIVWTWVRYEDDPTQGKDRPVLVVGRTGEGDHARLLGLMLSTKQYHRDDPNWLALGSGAWDAEHRPSFVRLDRVLIVAEHGIRREGAVLERSRFETVAAALRVDHGWQ